ncbi:uncharacterized protein LOC135401444 isoform X2 [Ornithodoros turicata]
MKPNFLGRQRGSARESRGRGRRSANRCLKFHNFIPSESITSEKDDGCQDDVWKVHAECRLQEEHGTKQIMVSQWSLSSDLPSSSRETKSPVPPPLPPLVTQSKEEPEPTTEAALKSAPFPGLFSSLRPSDHLPKTSDFLGIQDELFGDSGLVCSPTPYGCDNGDARERCATPSSTNSSVAESIKDDPEAFHRVLSKKHRRKPVQTRRVIPYNKYLSMMEDDECPQPLDLSFKTSRKATAGSAGAFVSPSLSPLGSVIRESDSSASHPLPVPHRFQQSSKMFQEKSPLQEALEAPLNRQSSPHFAYPVPHHAAMMMPPYAQGTAVPFGHALYKVPPSSTETQHSAMHSLYSGSPVSSAASSTLLAALQDSSQCQAGPSRASPDFQRSLRRPSQRSLIKQKLEDTFKQNGFLVKTKQVSDGDATFCKFRQLRKYTRYYLKSWHHHLPAEVHKLWKGFLPPKTLPGGHVMTEEPKESPESQ